MLFAPIVALGLIVPTPPPQLTAAHQFQRPQLTVVQQSSVLLSSDSDSLVFPPSSVTIAGPIDFTRAGGTGLLFKGSADDINLSSLLDDVPADPNGAAGLEKDITGVEKLKAREAAIEAAAAEKARLMIEMERGGK